MYNFIITGANSFLGQAISEHLSKSKDNKIMLVTRSDFNFGNIINDNITHISGIDLLNENHLEKICTDADLFFTGKINIINCTGYYNGQEPFETTSLSESNKIFQANFYTVLGITTYLTPLLIKKGGGHFVSFSCNSVKYNYPQMTPFTAAKSALESLMRSIANEFYDRGIYANSFQLATLFTNHELKVKPYGDHKNWLKTEEVAEYIETFIKQPVQIINGASINLYHYSESFFNNSYFDRIKR